MLDRSELKFNEELIKVFEHLQVDCWNPDYHFLRDKIKHEDYGWVYKSERIEEEFILFLNILYSTDPSRLKGIVSESMKIDYVSCW